MNEIVQTQQVPTREENYNLFSTKGVIGRKACFIYTIAYMIYCVISNRILHNIIDSNLQFLGGMFFVILLIFYYTSIVTAIKRLKDIGWYRWIGIFGIFPIFLLIISCISTKDANKTTRTTFLEQTKEFASAATMITIVGGYYILGIVQWFATYAGVYYFIHNWFFSVIIGGVLAYTPIIGTITGIYGAHNYWGWPLWAAILLFFIHIILAIIFVLVGYIAEKILENRHD